MSLTCTFGNSILLARSTPSLFCAVHAALNKGVLAKLPVLSPCPVLNIQFSGGLFILLS